MTKVRFTGADGAPYDVDAEDGSSAMRAALTSGVPGISADCGGEASCATCHVYVDASWLAAVGEPGLDEKDMLEFTDSERRDCSRLSCQIEIGPELDGLSVTLPESQ